MKAPRDHAMPSLPYVLALRAVESLVNQALRFDPATRQRLATLAGKSVYIETEAPRLSVMVQIRDGRIRLTPEAEQHPHATVEAHSVALLKLALSKQPQLIGGPLRVHGQVQVIEQLHAIGRQLDIDWEEPLAMLFGDSASHQLGQQMRGLFGFARKAAQTFLMNSGEFLQQEQDLLPVRWEVESFIDESQDLRADLERLEARTRRLRQRADALLARRATNRQDSPEHSA